ncbi:hypothetical protein SARC_17682, partial [Sphaeroforma arctica JP610]
EKLQQRDRKVVKLRESALKHKHRAAERNEENQALRDRLKEMLSVNMASVVSTPKGTT